MKKYSYIVMMVVVSLLLISTIACGAQSKIELTFYQWYYTEAKYGPVIDGYIGAFEEKFPNVKVNPVAITNRDYWDRLTMDIMSGVEGDVVGVDQASMAAYYYLRPEGAFISLDKYIEGTSFAEDLVLLDDMEEDGHCIALPYNWFTFGHIFYRKSHFEEAGLSVDGMGTWESFKEGAAKLTVDLDGDGRIDRYGMTLPSTAEAISRWWHQLWLWTAGGGFFKNEAPPYTAENVIFDCPANLFALEYLVDLKREAFAPGVRDPFQIQELFYNSSLSMFLGASWSLVMVETNMPTQIYEEDVDIMPMPSAYYQGELRPPVLVAWSTPLAISSRSKYPDTAWDFIEFLNSEEIQRDWITRVASPVNKKVLESSWYKTSFPKIGAFMNLSREFEWRMTPNIAQWNEIDKVIQEAVKSAYVEVKSPKEALDWGQAEIVKIMRK